MFDSYKSLSEHCPLEDKRMKYLLFLESIDNLNNIGSGVALLYGDHTKHEISHRTVPLISDSRSEQEEDSDCDDDSETDGNYIDFADNYHTLLEDDEDDGFREACEEAIQDLRESIMSSQSHPQSHSSRRNKKSNTNKSPVHRYVTPNSNSTKKKKQYKKSKKTTSGRNSTISSVRFSETGSLPETIATNSLTALDYVSTMSREQLSENSLDLWNILEEKLGFKYMDGTYQLPEIKSSAHSIQHPSFESLSEMQSYILKNKFLLPRESKLSEGEKELVQYWVCTGNTSFLDDTLSIASQSISPPLKSAKAWALLSKLGFKYKQGSGLTGSKYVIPNVTLSSRIEEVLAMKNIFWFSSIEGLQEWCLRNGIPQNEDGDFVEERRQLEEWASRCTTVQVL